MMKSITGEKGGAFIHDTLINALSRSKIDSPPKETILKPEEQLIKPVPLHEQEENIPNSRLSQSKMGEKREDPRQSRLESNGDQSNIKYNN